MAVDEQLIPIPPELQQVTAARADRIRQEEELESTLAGWWKILNPKIGIWKP